MAMNFKISGNGRRFFGIPLLPMGGRSLKAIKEIFLRQNRTRGSWVLGLDQGTGALRYVIWDKKSGRVVQFGRFELGHPDSSGGKSGADVPSLLRDIARLIPKNRLSAIHLNLQGNALTLGSLEIATGGKPLQPNMIRHALSSHFSIPIEGINTIFREVGQITEPGKTGEAFAKTILSYAACHKQITSQLVRTIQDLFGLVPDITTQGYAQEALLPFLKLECGGTEDVLAVINGGRSITSISIFRNGRLLFEREIPLAGQDITRSVFITYLQGQTLRSAEDLKIAEQLKKQSAIPLERYTGQEDLIQPAAPDSASEAQSVPGPPDHERLFQAIRGVLTAWVQDIRLSFAYFNEHYDSKIKIEKVFFTGGMANHTHLAEYLSRELNLRVLRMVWPAGHTAQGEGEENSRAWQENFHEYATALGLAMKPSFQFSLTPHEYLAADWVEIAEALLRVFSVVGLALLVISFSFLQMQESNLRKLKAVVEEHRHFLSKLEGPYQEMVRWESFFARSDYPRPSAADFLKTLNRISPPNLVLVSTSYSREAGEILLEGFIYGDPRQRAITLADFSKIFKKNPQFKNVEVPLWEPAASGADKGHFRLVAQYRQQEAPKS